MSCTSTAGEIRIIAGSGGSYGGYVVLVYIVRYMELRMFRHNPKVEGPKHYVYTFLTPGSEWTVGQYCPVSSGVCAFPGPLICGLQRT